MITIVDYIGHCDKKGMPMGHPVKVVNEYSRLLKENVNVSVAIPKSHAEFIDLDVNKFNLDNNVYVYSTNRKHDFFNKIKNLNDIRKIKTDTLWFINVDFTLFLFLSLVKPRYKAKVWITLCYNPLRDINKFRKYVIKYALKHTNLIWVSNKNLINIAKNTIFLPDYYYENNIYDKYLIENKINQILCVGTMGENKQLEDLVDTFKDTSLPIQIIGNFNQSIERYEALKKRSGYNIKVINKYVLDDEYYNLIASSKYVILPYDMKMYDERTSGILLETVFLKSIPIAPSKLLEFNGIAGIGYNKLNDIIQKLNNLDEDKKILEKNEKNINEVFNSNSMKKLLLQHL